MKKAFFIVALISLVGIIEVIGQKAPIKFGNVDIADLEMTVYDGDSSAPAVILCDYGYWSLSDYQFRRIVRYKVLTPEGLDYANKVYPGAESTQIRGRTYNLENGEIIEEKLKSESIFKERVYEDYYRLRVAMPNVKVGSVFEIEFTSQGIPDVWKFQQEIPVKWSELILPESQYIDFRKNFFGYLPLALNTSDHWIAKDMPAFKEEPYTNSIENYINKFEFDILSVHFPGYYREYTTDWNAVARRLTESDYFGGTINAALYLNALSKSIQDSDSTELGRLKAAYRAVKKIKWDEQESLWPTTTTLMSIYNKEIGNSAEINIILVNLLRKLDIPAHPVVMSTRSNGLLPAYSASMNKLNYVIAYAKIGETVYLLDATEEIAPFGLLPIRCLNGQGRIINKEISAPVTLKTDKKDKSTEMYNLNLTDDLSLVGTYSSSKSEYGAYNFRKDYKSFNGKDEFIEYNENVNPGLTINSCEIENIDSIDYPIKEKYEIELKNQVYSIDDKIYINPMLHNQLKENPFKADERKYPIDFAYCRDNTYIIKIKIPEGYTATELPANVKIELPNKGAKVIYQATTINNEVSITYKFVISQEVFLFDQYPFLKEFYNQIIKKHAEPIILSKI